MDIIYRYVMQIGTKKYNNPSIDLPALRQFMRYMYEERVIQEDFAEKIPYNRAKTSSKIPSIYSKDEIRTLIDSFDRATKVGKRNYAIALLATYLGMRASDIRNLKFDNINWEDSTINFIQMKTKVEVQFPLLPEIGNAIIDYLKYARPISDAPSIFITCKYPYVKFGPSVVSHIIQRAFKQTGININSRRFGAHALRHSLADRLLKMRTNYPMIAAILGHSDSNVTMVYLNIDLKALEICIADVPPVDKKFYEQKGGIFYV